MGLLAILLVALGIFKLYVLGRVNWEDFEERASYLPIDVERLSEIVQVILLTDGLVSLLCGAYILFI